MFVSEYLQSFLHLFPRVKEIRSNQGGGSVAPKQPEVLPSQQAVGKEPSSPVQSDLQYLHLSLQKVCALLLNVHFKVVWGDSRYWASIPLNWGVPPPPPHTHTETHTTPCLLILHFLLLLTCYCCISSCVFFLHAHTYMHTHTHTCTCTRHVTTCNHM